MDFHLIFFIFEFLIAVTMKDTIFWDVTQCCLVKLIHVS
jgi:hypothetical protein